MATQRIPFDHPVTGETLWAVCSISGRYSSATFNEPAEYPEVDIVKITDDDRAERPEVMVLIEEDDALRTSIEEAALEDATAEPDDEPDYEREFNDAREFD